MDVTPQDAAFVRELVHRRSAILLDSEKDYFIQMRLAQLASDKGVGSIGELVQRARAGMPGADISIIEALTTHETSFFRDVHPFEALRTEVIPGLIARREACRQLVIWCIACSTGQEPYSIAMLLKEHFPQLANWKVTIIGTDLSERVLERARAAEFSQLEVNRGLPAAKLVRYFERSGMHWRLRAELRAMVEFRKLNLIDTWSLSPTPDVVMLRNVLIYFDVPSKRRILDRIREQIAPDGTLFLGSAETTLNVAEGWERVPHERNTSYKVRVPS